MSDPQIPRSSAAQALREAGPVAQTALRLEDPFSGRISQQSWRAFLRDGVKRGLTSVELYHGGVVAIAEDQQLFHRESSREAVFAYFIFMGRHPADLDAIYSGTPLSFGFDAGEKGAPVYFRCLVSPCRDTNDTLGIAISMQWQPVLQSRSDRPGGIGRFAM